MSTVSEKVLEKFRTAGLWPESKGDGQGWGCVRGVVCRERPCFSGLPQQYLRYCLASSFWSLRVWVCCMPCVSSDVWILQGSQTMLGTSFWKDNLNPVSTMQAPTLELVTEGRALLMIKMTTFGWLYVVVYLCSRCLNSSAANIWRVSLLGTQWTQSVEQSVPSFHLTIR